MPGSLKMGFSKILTIDLGHHEGTEDLVKFMVCREHQETNFHIMIIIIIS